MRIIYIHQYFKTPSIAGSSRSYEMARRLASRGHDVHIITSSRDGIAQPTRPVDNFTVHHVSVQYSQTMTYKARIKAFLSFAVLASAKARSLRGDIVFATSTPLTVAIPGIFATALRGRPLVFEVRDLWPDAPIAMGALPNRPLQKLARMLEKFTYRYSTHIVALSPDMKKAIVSKGVRSEKISVIPNASDNQLFEENGRESTPLQERLNVLSGQKVILYCGTLGKVNDVSYIARLAAETKKHDPSLLFLVVGEGNDEAKVRETAHSLGVLDDNFFMMKAVPKTQVPGLFAAADLSMSTVAPIPELQANSANKVFDSFASGTPLAINHGGWIADLLQESSAGIVLSPSDIGEASRQLSDFLASSERVARASGAAKKLAVEIFDRQKLADQLADVLEGATDKLPHSLGTLPTSLDIPN